jgi:hypothetical protein
MPQSERLSAHALLDEIEDNPVLRKRFMDILLKEFTEPSELRSCLIGIVENQITCLNQKKKPM